MIQEIVFICSLLLITFGFGYGAGRRQGRREGLKEGLIRAPLEIRRDSFIKGRCIICTPDMPEETKLYDTLRFL